MSPTERTSAATSSRDIRSTDCERARLLAPHRRRIGTPRNSRALGPYRQAALVLRWFRERSCVHCLARDAGVSQATGYRYLHEGIDVLAGQAPDLHEVLGRCRGEGMIHVILDGTLIASDRVAGPRENGNELWFSQKHKAFGGNVQFLAAPDGTPLWVSDTEPGSTPDITAARLHAFPALYKAAADGLPTLADKGYIGSRHRHPRPNPPSERPVGTSPARRHTNYEQPDQGPRPPGELHERQWLLRPWGCQCGQLLWRP